jgi:signal transduction histidine kinase
VSVRVEEDRVLYGIVAAFIVVALAFLASSVATFLDSREIDRSGRELITNSLPSVTGLMRARTAARDIDVDVDERAGTTAAGLFDDVAAARARLGDAIHEARSTPNYPGELELYQSEVMPRLVDVDRAIEGIHTVAAKTPDDEARLTAAVMGLDRAAKELDAGLAAVADLNHVESYQAAHRIIGTRAFAVRLMLVLEAGSTLLAITAAVVAVRGGRRYAFHARQQLDRESARASELDLLAQRVAHDLMSPLAAVSLSLGAIQKVHADPDTTRSVERGRRALDRTRHMVQAIYSFSGSGARPEPGASSNLRPPAVEAAEEVVAAEAQSPPVIDVEEFEDVAVAMSRPVLGVVMTNLLSNASKFTRGSPERHVTVRARADDARVHVEVEDTGPGVPPGLEQAIFEPYRRAPGLSQPGLGLGLATVKRIVLAHGGTLGVAKAQAGGAVFWFEVPRAIEAPSDEMPAAPGDAESQVLH